MSNPGVVQAICFWADPRYHAERYEVPFLEQKRFQTLCNKMNVGLLAQGFISLSSRTENLREEITEIMNPYQRYLWRRGSILDIDSLLIIQASQFNDGMFYQFRADARQELRRAMFDLTGKCEFLYGVHGCFTFGSKEHYDLVIKIFERRSEEFEFELSPQIDWMHELPQDLQ